MRPIVVDRLRIGDPAAGEGEAGLALEEGQLVDQADAVRMRRRPARGSPARRSGATARIADPARRGLDLQQRLELEHAARAVADDRSSRRPTAGRHRVRADRAGGGIAGHEDPHAATSPISRFARRLVEPREDPVADHRRRAAGAEAEAIDGLDLDPLVALEAKARCASTPRAWQASARQSLIDRPVRRHALEIVVEGDDAVHLGARQVQRLGDERHGVRRDMAERGLHVVQDRQQGALAPLVTLQDFGDLLVFRHRHPLLEPVLQAVRPARKAG